MGAPIFGAGRLIRANSIITIQSSTVAQDGDGGTAETFTNLATGIEVLITEHTGGRQQNFGTDNERCDVIVSGVDARMARPDVRFVVTSSETLSELSGWVLRINSAQSHPAGLGGLQCARVTCRCTKLELPATFATTAPLGG